jgi:cytochrome c-type biogenesis protein CcmE
MTLESAPAFDDESTPDAGELPELDLTPRPPREKKSTGRLYLVAIVLVLVLVAGFFAVKALGSATVYFYQANEAVAQKDQLGTKRFRMLGNVEANTVQRSGVGVNFTVDYDGAEVPVQHVGDPPELFMSGAPVVLEGHWNDSQTVFLSDTILVKHSEDYVQKNPDRKTSADTAP